jgi:hypothetical protein
MRHILSEIIVLFSVHREKVYLSLGTKGINELPADVIENQLAIPAPDDLPDEMKAAWDRIPDSSSHYLTGVAEGAFLASEHWKKVWLWLELHYTGQAAARFKRMMENIVVEADIYSDLLEVRFAQKRPYPNAEFNAYILALDDTTEYLFMLDEALSSGGPNGPTGPGGQTPDRGEIGSDRTRRTGKHDELILNTLDGKSLGFSVVKRAAKIEDPSTLHKILKRLIDMNRVAKAADGTYFRPDKPPRTAA